MIVLTNTQTSAQVAAAHLTRAQVIEGQEVAGAVATAIWQRLFDSRHNPWPAPAPNTREQAVRTVQHIGNPERPAVDVHHVVQVLRELGHPSSARRLDFSVRRDLEQRERGRGLPRLVSVPHLYADSAPPDTEPPRGPA